MFQANATLIGSEVRDIGSISAEYRASTGRLWAGSQWMAVLGAAFILMGLAASSMSSDIRPLVLCSALGSAFLGMAAWQWMQSVRDRPLRVLVAENGLVCVNLGKARLIFWDDIASVLEAVTLRYVNGAQASAMHVYTLTLKNGSKVVFDGLMNNVETLGSTIQEETTRRLLPAYAHVYNTGGTVAFGKITLNSIGMGNEVGITPWSQVEDLKVESGRIFIRRHSKWSVWSSQTVSATPNLFVFLTLVDRILMGTINR